MIFLFSLTQLWCVSRATHQSLSQSQSDIMGWDALHILITHKHTAANTIYLPVIENLNPLFPLLPKPCSLQTCPQAGVQRGRRMK